MKRAVLLWMAILLGPAVWFASFCANFVLAPWACAAIGKPALYGVSATGLLVTAGCGITGWVEWRNLGREFPGESGGAVARSRTLASGAVLLSGMFFLVILAQLVAEAVLGACQ